MNEKFHSISAKQKEDGKPERETKLDKQDPKVLMSFTPITYTGCVSLKKLSKASEES